MFLKMVPLSSYLLMIVFGVNLAAAAPKDYQINVYASSIRRETKGPMYMIKFGLYSGLEKNFWFGSDQFSIGVTNKHIELFVYGWRFHRKRQKWEFFNQQEQYSDDQKRALFSGQEFKKEELPGVTDFNEEEMGLVLDEMDNYVQRFKRHELIKPPINKQQRADRLKRSGRFREEAKHNPEADAVPKDGKNTAEYAKQPIQNLAKDAAPNDWKLTTEEGKPNTLQLQQLSTIDRLVSEKLTELGVNIEESFRLIPYEERPLKKVDILLRMINHLH